MAEQPGQERSEEATDKRLQDARKKGQVPRSKELNTFAVMFAGAVFMVATWESMLQDWIGLFRRQFTFTRKEIFDPQILVTSFSDSMVSAFASITPLLIVTIIAAFVSSIAISGWIFSTQAIGFKLERLNLLKGIGRVISIRGLIELIKAILKVSLVLGVAWSLFSQHLNDFIDLNRESLVTAVGHSSNLVGNSFLVLCGSLIVIVLIDVPYQIWDHKRQLKMTRQEVKDESKERDGNPQIKSRIRSVQMEMAQQRMMEKVPQADVIVTNPTHYAVALKYDLKKSNAPRVVAKGKDLIAAQIRNLAQGAGVPLVAAPPLARALYYTVKLDAEIPEGLYVAVAQILAYVYQLSEAGRRGGDYPLPPEHVPLPKEFEKPVSDYE